MDRHALAKGEERGWQAGEGVPRQDLHIVEGGRPDL